MRIVLDAGCDDARKKDLIVELWRACGVPTESRYDQSALSLAVLNNNPIAVNTLLSICGATFSRVTDPPRILTLHEPVQESQMSVLRLLAQYAPRLIHELSVDRAPYDDQSTALHTAVKRNNTEAAEILVNVFGASLDVVDAQGRRPSFYLRPDAPPELRGLLGAM